jgi:hypothetical protein
MTASQTKKYWQTWGRVRKALTDLGDFSKTDADEERHHIHLDALGKKKSSKDLKNSDLDKIFDAFDSILVLFDGPTATDRTTTGPIKRLIWAIDQLALDEPYIAKIAQDTYKTTDWRTLNERQLTHFRYTLTRAARAKKAALKV